MNKRTIKLEIRAGKASLQPPIGPILGQYGIPGAKFCQDFNDKTKIYDDNIILSVKITLLNKKIISINYLPNINKSLQRLIIPNYQSSRPLLLKSLKLINKINNRERLLKNINLNKKKLINRELLKAKKQRIKQLKKSKKVELIYNYIYLEDIYNLRKSLLNNNNKLKELIKELIRRISTMQIYIISNNAIK